MQNNKKTLSLFFLLIILKQLVWISIIPMWHAPDEQAHFAQVQNIAEKNVPAQFSSSREIEISEKLLGVKRDIRGNNKFTYHPEYKIDYTGSINGLYEKMINIIPTNERKNLTLAEATGYPPLYYQFSAIGYKIAYGIGLTDRVFFTRIWQSILYILTIYIYYKSAKQLLNNKTIILSFLIFVSFLPMPSFIAAGITSDNLMNLLFCVGLYLAILIVKNGINVKYLILTACLTIIGIYTKPHFLILAPIFWSSMFAYFLRAGRVLTMIYITLLCLVFLPVIFSIFYPVFWEDFLATKRIISLLPEVAYQINPGSNHANLGQYFFASLVKTYRETLPWFWGIFRWLSFSLDRWYYRILNFLTVVALVSGVVYFLKNIRRKKNTLFWQIIFLVVSILIYASILFFWDYLFFSSHGFSFGIQGRYYFPVLFSIIFLFFYFIHKIFSAKLLAIFSIMLNSYALIKVAASYYDISSVRNFVIQASQYKPWYFKRWGLAILLLTYLTVSLFFLIQLIRDKRHA